MLEPRKRHYGPRTVDEVLEVLAVNSMLDGECIRWTGPLTDEGYGQFSWQSAAGRITGAHRLSYSVTVGPIDQGLVIDHLCRNRWCINPDHLDPVTDRENVMRSDITLATINSAKTHCKNGHEYTPDNTAVYFNSTRKSTERRCRICIRSANARARAKRQVVS